MTFVPMIFGGERGMDNCGEEICGGDIPEEYEVAPVQSSAGNSDLVIHNYIVIDHPRIQ